MSSRTVSSFWNEQARATCPGNCSSTNATTRSASQASTSAGSCKEHLLQRVPAQPEPERLERDHLVGRDVAEVDRGAELLDEPGLRRLRRRLEDDVLGAYRAGDLADQLGAHTPRRVEDPGRAPLARLGHLLPGAAGELLAQPLRP